MPVFNFFARKEADSQLLRGTVEADTLEVARTHLTQLKLRVEKIQPAPPGAKPGRNTLRAGKAEQISENAQEIIPGSRRTIFYVASFLLLAGVILLTRALAAPRPASHVNYQRLHILIRGSVTVAGEMRQRDLEDVRVSLHFPEIPLDYDLRGGDIFDSRGNFLQEVNLQALKEPRFVNIEYRKPGYREVALHHLPLSGSPLTATVAVQTLIASAPKNSP